MRDVAWAIIRLAVDEPNLIRQVVGAVADRGATGTPERLLMRKAEYAKRAGFSVRTLDKFIEAGLPVFGHGKRLRIVVAKADEWLLSQDAEHLDDLDVLALTNARRVTGSRGSDG